MPSRYVSKVIDAFSTIGIAAIMQILVIGPWVKSRLELTKGAEASGYHFIGYAMVMFFFFCLSFTFFIMALIKYRRIIKEEAFSKYKYIIFSTKILNFVIGICITIELCFAIHRILGAAIGFK